MYPLDTVKTHMQALKPGQPRNLSVLEVVRSIARDNGGLGGYWRGCTAIASGCVPAHIALFTSYEYSKKRLLTSDGEHEPLRAAMCGACATVCHDLIITPMDVVKQRMQLGVHRGIGDCLRATVRREGLGGLYRSMPTTLAMNVPFGGVLVASNESLKLSLGLGSSSGSSRPSEPGSELPWYFLSAGLSGALASFATQPLDVVKTRLQTQDLLSSVYDDLAGTACSSSKPSRTEAEPGPRSSGASSAAPAGSAEGARAAEAGRGAACSRTSANAAPKYTGFVPAVSTILREEGASAFFRGIVPRMIHAAPSAAMCWGTYETVKTFLA